MHYLVVYNAVFLLKRRDSSRRWRCWLIAPYPWRSPEYSRPGQAGFKTGASCSVRPVRPGWWGRLGMGLFAGNRQSDHLWKTLNESVHHMANMDLKTGNKLEGKRRRARPVSSQCRWGRTFGCATALDCNLARRSRLRIENGTGRREVEGPQFEIVFSIIDGHMLTRRT